MHDTTPALRIVKATFASGEASQAPEALFRRYASYVAAIAIRLVGRDDEIEDIVQEVFLAVVGGVHQLQDAQAVKGWLATLTTRTVLRRLRWRRIRVWLGRETPPSYENLPDPRLSGEERAAVALIYRTLDRLPAPDRVAWTLHHGEDLPNETVARLCGCSLATAKRRIASVNERIRKAIVDG